MTTRYLPLLACLLPLTLLPARATAPPKPKTFYYEPAQSTLTGKIARVVFPGPPNYESVKKGDAPEVCWVLTLTNKIQVRPKPGAKPEDVNEFDTPEDNVSDVQLAFRETNAYQKYRVLLGKPVVVAGGLFHSHTAHHHTAVLLSVASLKAAVPFTPKSAAAGVSK